MVPRATKTAKLKRVQYLCMGKANIECQENSMKHDGGGGMENFDEDRQMD